MSLGHILQARARRAAGCFTSEGVTCFAGSFSVWYAPNAEARKSAKRGPTVADLKRRGAVANSDAELNSLVVGKTLNVRNTVTGRRLEILYSAGGSAW